jgi:hypothetical protein
MLREVLTRVERAQTLKQMKKTLVTALCVLAICSASVTPCRAENDKALKVITDVAVLRPAGLVATAVGSVFFLVSLPFAATTHSIKDTAHTLIVSPAKATFQRPLGNYDAVVDMMED